MVELRPSQERPRRDIDQIAARIGAAVGRIADDADALDEVDGAALAHRRAVGGAACNSDRAHKNQLALQDGKVGRNGQSDCLRARQEGKLEPIFAIFVSHGR